MSPRTPAWSTVFDTDAMTSLATTFPAHRRQGHQPEVRVEHLVAPHRTELGPQGRRPDRRSSSPWLQYGDVMAAGANTPQPLGLGGGMDFWWKDADADSKVELAEIFWQYSSVHADTSQPALRPLQQRQHASPTRPSPRSRAASRATPISPGNYSDYDWANPTAVNYDNLTTFYRSDVDPNAKNVKTSPRTREIMLFLERELRPDLAASVNATYRRYDNFDWAKYFYPADIYPVDARPGDRQHPDVVHGRRDHPRRPSTIGGITYTMGGRRRPDLVPAHRAATRATTPYRMVDKSTAYRTYFGLDLIVTKRLSNRWFLNASVTLQDQRVHWNGSFIDPTNKWALDGQPYGNWGGRPAARRSVQMYARWMAKLSALYQLPWGFNVSATLLAREGWKVPNYVTLAYSDSDSWPGLYRSNTVYVQLPTKDSLPVFYNLNLRLEKNDRRRHREDVPDGRRLQRLQFGHRQPGLRRLLRDVLRRYRGRPSVQPL